MRTPLRIPVALVLITSWARAADPIPSELLSKNSKAFSFAAGTLEGPGWELMKRETANTQFILLGEGHDDKLTPTFADALYRSMKAAHGFDHLALEQDPVAMELACGKERSGNPRAVADLAMRYPTMFEFASDQDLTFIAKACAIGRGPAPVWGLEQALGAERYLEELEALAPTPAIKATKWQDLDAWMKPVLPESKPGEPTLIDLRALRGYQRLFRVQVAEKDQWQIRDLMNAFDAIVILPDGPPAEWQLTGFSKLGS